MPKRVVVRCGFRCSAGVTDCEGAGWEEEHKQREVREAYGYKLEDADIYDSCVSRL